MKAMKKVLALLLLLTTCFLLLVACQEPDAGDGGNGTEDGDGNGNGDDPNRDDAPEVKDFGGYEFIIKNDTWLDYEVCAPTELNGQGLNDVVYRRNKEVEDLYNITIKQTGDPNISAGDAFAYLSQQAKSGDYYADLYSHYARSMISSFVLNGYFYNVYDLESWDLEADRWDSAFLEATTIRNHAYTLTGNIQTNDEIHQLSLATNLSLFEQTYTDVDLYEVVVTEGNFTWDTFLGYWQGFGQDVGIKTKVDLEDRIGFCYAAGMSSFFYAADIKTFKMENDEPVLNVTSDRSYDLIDFMSNIFTGNMDTAEFSSSIHDMVLLDYDLREQHFTGGNMLFTTVLFSDALQYLDMEDDLVYLPYPKFDEYQEEYLTPMQPYFAPLAVSAYVLDAERTALITDALAYYSDDLQEEVVDVLLQERLTHEVKPREILILTFDSMVYDMDYIANITGFDAAISSMVNAKRSFETYASDMKSLSDKAINAKGRGTLQLFIKKYTAN